MGRTAFRVHVAPPDFVTAVGLYSGDFLGWEKASESVTLETSLSLRTGHFPPLFLIECFFHERSIAIHKEKPGEPKNFGCRATKPVSRGLITYLTRKIFFVNRKLSPRSA